jgi:AraC family transcriptional regulator of adaptative response/methylated-DNA-[protein]-cysteine methyltransferase
MKPASTSAAATGLKAGALRSALPPRSELVRAYLAGDEDYEGIFFTAVKTTGIFCRPACPARKPKPQNVEFFASAQEALFAGFRPCKRCRPMQPVGASPEWLAPLLRRVEAEPARRWRNDDLRQLGLDPARVARWFTRHHNMTFHAYSRSRRLASALAHIQQGDTVTTAAFDAGYESVSAFNEAFRKFAGAAPGTSHDAPVAHIDRIATPLGAMVAASIADEIVLLEFADRRMLPTQFQRLAKVFGCVCAPGADAPVLQALRCQLDEYFAGSRRDFDVPVRVKGTPFQESVWNALLRIPCGVTRSYADVARAIGRPTAVRAVANANGDNRICILIPCHRVIGSDGTLTGYGGGLWRKQRLLEVEEAPAAAGGGRLQTSLLMD